MAGPGRTTSREAKRQQTRERLLGAAIAEFKRAGMAEADVATIVSAAGVAHGTFYFHFPTKEYVLLELEVREQERISKQFIQFAADNDLQSCLAESVRLIKSLERRLGDALFKDFLALHFSQTRPPAESEDDHPMIGAVAERIATAQAAGEVAPEVNPMSSAVFFLLGVYALLITTNDSTRDALLADALAGTYRSLKA
ncbi:MAG: TetR/AcrR family transcriptional regulator [Candidatus Nanopelagicales bacterium]